MRRQTVASSFDNMAFGTDLTARRPFDFLRRFWQTALRGIRRSGRNRPASQPQTQDPENAARFGELVVLSTPVPVGCTQAAAEADWRAEEVVLITPAPVESPTAPADAGPSQEESVVTAPVPAECSQATAETERPREDFALSIPVSVRGSQTATVADRPPENFAPPIPAESDQTHELHRQCESIVHSLRHVRGGADPGPRVIGLTSCYSGEGVTTLATHVALTAAASDLRVLLVDFNFDSPSIHKRFRTSLRPGLADWLQEGQSAMQEVAVPKGSLTLVTAGSAPAADCGSYVERMGEFLGDAAGKFDFVFIDLPPLSGPADALPLCELLDGVLLLVQAERVRWQVAKRFLTRLERSGGKPLGAILNKSRQYIPNWAYRTL